MTTYAGSGGTVSVATNTIAEIVSFQFDATASTIPDSNLNDTAETYKAGKTGASGSIECHWDPTDTTGQNAMVAGNSMAFILYPRGSTSGDPTIEFTGIITSVGTGVQSEAIISQSYAIQATGAITYGTVT